MPLLLLFAASGARAAEEGLVPRPAVAVSSAAFAEADRLYFHRHQGDNLERAIAALEARIRADSGDAGALWRLGRAKVRRAERKTSKAERLALFREAEALSRRAVAAAPDDPDAHCGLGIALGRRGQEQGMLRSMFLVDPIREAMRTTLLLRPDHAPARLVQGEMLRQLPRFAGGSKKKAAEEFERALASSPNYTAVHVPLAETYLDLGEPEKARAVLRRLLEVRDPDDPAEFPENVEDGRELLERLGPAR